METKEEYGEAPVVGGKWKREEVEESAGQEFPDKVAVGEVGGRMLQMPITRQGDKRTFRCELCLLELSSLETRLSHEQGAKHTMKALAKREEQEALVLQGELAVEEMEREWIVAIANPESGRRKVPVRLHERVRECRDPVVGLAFVTELLAESDPEMEPQYRCELCGKVGPSNGMFTHLLGGPHRRAVLEHLENRPFAGHHEELLRRVERLAENDKDLGELITTERSDATYPWPPGRAPWAVGMGGDGAPPPGAPEAAQAQRLLPAPGTVRAPRDAEEARDMMESARAMGHLVLQFARREGIVTAEEAEVIARAVGGSAAGGE